jgi:uncharacterized surface protein with fasciclin (FAS1) repeats
MIRLKGRVEKKSPTLKPPPECAPYSVQVRQTSRKFRGEDSMRKTLYALFMATVLAAPIALTASAQTDNPMVGGAPMYRSKNIVENAVNSADHTTLVAAVKAAGLVDTLSGKGPFTVFAPTNAAFDKLPAGTVQTLLMPENKGMLTKVLTYHVVAGRYDSKKLMQLIKKGGGQARLTTVSGGTLIARMNGMNGISLTDEKGGTSNVTTANVYQSNGVIHVVDTVLMPQ